MAIDRKQKKKNRRKKIRKKKVQARSLQVQQEKLREYQYLVWEAGERGDHRSAWRLAMKCLKIRPGHRRFFDLALIAAAELEDTEPLYKVLLYGWEHELLTIKGQYLRLAQFGVENQRYEFAAEVLNEMFEALPAHQKRLTKQERRWAKQVTEYAEFLTSEKTRAFQSPGSAAVNKAAGKGNQRQEPLAGVETDSAVSETVAETKEADPVPELQISFRAESSSFLQALDQRRWNDWESFDLCITAYQLSYRASYDQLLCLSTLNGVESLWYQVETARKVMKSLRGRAILADEVGLGKTIEACLVLKEYMLRGLVKSVLVLVPSALIDQWREELSEKFGLTFVTSSDPLFRQDPEQFWRQPYLLVSIQTARLKRHFAAVTARSYDMVIVDEAHHLKNHTTLNWKLVNALQKTYLLLLTATPVQNKLEELYNLVTLLKPGHLKTRKAFKEEFVARGDPTDPRNRERLRGLLKEVMVRNTRSVAQLHLPPRFATTIRLPLNPQERAFYDGVSRLVTEVSAATGAGLSKLTLRKLLEATGSSHVAALRMLERLEASAPPPLRDRIRELAETGRAVSTGAKADRVIELLRAVPGKIIVFINHVATLEHLEQLLGKAQISHVVYRGGLSPAQKSRVIDGFASGCRVLLTTATGGEGHNLQFCHQMINYDLPWNPMEIEQRIGRIHRIGQKQPVQVYSFCAEDTIEDRILEILDRKINMFELVVGEMDMILGRLRGEGEFSDMVYELWVSQADDKARKKAFETFGARLKRARSAYEKSKELDEKLFKEDFGI